jgi:hypothetical protein
MQEPWQIVSAERRLNPTNGGTHGHIFEDWEYGFPVRETDLWQDEGGMG